MDFQPRTESLIRSILQLACEGLLQTFIPEERLFCHVLRMSPGGQMQAIEISHRYTMMTLLGLNQLEKVGQRSPVPISPVIDALLKDLSWITRAGDLGLLLWLCAIVSPERLRDIHSKSDVGNAIQSYNDTRHCSTTELAWLLAGLSHAKLAWSERTSKFDSVAQETYRLLVANQGPWGIFGHLATNRSLKGRLRGSIGTFADQVYPIYALAHFGNAFCDQDAILRAQKCAEAIVRLQGAQGEWWWHYDAASGGVIRRYPVYSVHQDGMAPMALLALTSVARELNFSKAIELGLGWIEGTNIVKNDMRDFDRKLIWRSIALQSHEPSIQELMFMVAGRVPRHTARNPHVVYECRPYELGWALYALAGEIPMSGTGVR